MYSVVGLVLANLFYVASGQGNNCRTPFNENGQCIQIRDCTSIWRIVTEAPRPWSTEVVNFLQNSVCGNPSERRVCCRLQDIADTAASRPNGNTETAGTTGTVLTHRNINLLDQRNCGPDTSDRIANGNETVLFEFPWMALLGYEDVGATEPDWKCGGSVINRR